MIVRAPYEPPPDYPLIDDHKWNLHRSKSTRSTHIQTARSHSIDASHLRSSSSFIAHSRRPAHRRYDYPICGVSPSEFDPPRSRYTDEMLKSRQFPEIAGIYHDEQPSLRRFTKYNQSMTGKTGTSSATIIMENDCQHSPPPSVQQQSPKKDGGSIFSKGSRKPLFFMGNWTFRDKSSKNRPSLFGGNPDSASTTRPFSMHFGSTSSSRASSGDSSASSSPVSSKYTARSKSGGARGRRDPEEERLNRTSIAIGTIDYRRPVDCKIERSAMVSRKPSNLRSSSTSGNDFKTNIIVDDAEEESSLHPQQPLMRCKQRDDASPSFSSNADDEDSTRSFSLQSCLHMRKSCPDLDSNTMANFEQHRISKKKNRRAKEKAQSAMWKRKHVKDWSLDDILLWLQSFQMDQVASLLIGYDLRGEDLLKWEDETLEQLGVQDAETRRTLLSQLSDIIANGPEPLKPNNTRAPLFDIVKLTSFDQVLAVETPLTTRDITVTHGRFGCLQITKVNGANLPLKENDCLLEINERAGEQFKSALMLTKLISDSNGNPIRFVVLRRKCDEPVMSTKEKESTSSSGVSSIPQSPTHDKDD